VHEDHRFAARRAFELYVDPEEAEVWVDGRSMGPAFEHEGDPPLVLSPGRHLVRLTHPGYKPMVIELTVSPEADDRIGEVEIELEEID
jgi:hypothetical protein